MRKWLKITFWFIFITGMITLMTMIRVDQLARPAGDPEIVIHKDGEDVFLTDDELLGVLMEDGLVYSGQTFEKLELEKIEDRIESISQVRSVEVYSNVGNNWKIDVYMREPIARIFNLFGESFYLDKEGEIVETTEKHTARVPVVTGEIRDRIDEESVDEIINNDSLISIRKLDDIYRISNYVCYDPLFRSLIGQIYLEKNGDFILVPLIGDQKIVFGSAYSEKEVEEKFEKLRIFYEEGMPNVGWNAYSEISVKYEGQIVCKKPTVD